MERVHKMIVRFWLALLRLFGYSLGDGGMIIAEPDIGEWKSTGVILFPGVE